MLFHGRPELPVATLQPAVRSRRVRADLRRWLDAQLGWLRPRLVPLLVACIGLFATLGAARGILRYAQCERLRLHSELWTEAWDAPGLVRLRVSARDVTFERGAPEPLLLIRPTTPGGLYIGLRLDSTNSR